MEEKIIDLRKTVYELCTEHPELALILADLGFTDIVKPRMLGIAGRFMTLPKGAAMKKIDLEQIKQGIEKHGYIVKTEV